MAKEGSGLILGLVVGVAGLVISVIIAFIIVATIADVETDIGTSIHGFTITNETVNAAGAFASLNDTPYTLGRVGDIGFASPSITRLYNISDIGPHVEINIANATLTPGGVLTNGTTISGGWSNVSVSYTYSRQQTVISTQNLRANFTKGIDNISEQIPTVLLIAAVVLILGILALLWAQYQRMNIGGSGSGSGL